MKKLFRVLLLTILLSGTIFIVTGCDMKKEEKKTETVSDIKLNKEQYIKQLKPIKINNTNDTVTITEKVKWEVPKESDGDTTVSFTIAIPYTLTVDNKEYKGVYYLGDYKYVVPDGNPKYNFSIKNLTKNGDISVYITGR